jgi:hypothetical protein
MPQAEVTQAPFPPCRWQRLLAELGIDEAAALSKAAAVGASNGKH